MKTDKEHLLFLLKAKRVARAVDWYITALHSYRKDPYMSWTEVEERFELIEEELAK